MERAVGYDLPGLSDLLSSHMRARLRTAGSPRRCRDGELIHQRGEIYRKFSIVRAGAVRMENTGLDGTALTTAFLRPGSSFGEFMLVAGLPRTHDAVAVGPTMIDEIDYDVFERLLDSHPELVRALLSLTALRLHFTLEALDDLQRLRLTVRLAKLLLRLARLAPDEIVGNGAVEKSQEELAAALGVSRVSLGKAVAELRTSGLICPSYRRIELPDVPSLERWLSARTLITPLRSSLTFAIPPDSKGP